MKPTKKEVETAKKTAKKIEKKESNKRLDELEELILLIDKKIIALEKDMITMQKIHSRIRTRMGV